MMLSKKNSDALDAFSEKLEVEGRSLWQDARRRFIHNCAALISLLVLLVITLFVIFAPLFSQFAYDDTDWGMMSAAPDNHFWPLVRHRLLGARSTGARRHRRPYFADGRHRFSADRGDCRHALRLDCRLPRRQNRLGYDAYSGDPEFLSVYVFVILLVTFFWRNILLIFAAIGMVSWLDMVRIVRGQTLGLKRKEFIEAAHVGGVSTGSIVLRHIVPNVFSLVVVYASLLVPSMILFESFLSFLGLGTQEPLSSWGALLSDGANSMEVSLWLLLFPAGFLVVTLFCFNFIGDGLRDALDPKDL
ncbi:Oligopeptide transport system permease protein OppC|nr:Oligopeptide transport system permease protein OppC [Candidatus Pantoea persica]